MKHKNIAKRVLACGLAVAMVVTSGNYSSVSVSAAKKTKKAAKKTKAKLSKKKASITAGGTLTLKVKKANKKVKWSIKNKKIAKVAATSGKKKETAKILGVKKGSTVVVAKVGKVKLKCKVTVKANKIKSVSVDKLDHSALTVKFTKKTPLNAGDVKIAVKDYKTGSYNENPKVEALSTKDQKTYRLYLTSGVALSDFVRVTVGKFSKEVQNKQKFYATKNGVTILLEKDTTVNEKLDGYFYQPVGYISYSLKKGSKLPKGLSLVGKRGKLKGIPNTPGTTETTIIGKDEAGRKATLKVTFKVYDETTIAAADSPNNEIKLDDYMAAMNASRLATATPPSSQAGTPSVSSDPDAPSVPSVVPMNPSASTKPNSDTVYTSYKITPYGGSGSYKYDLVQTGTDAGVKISTDVTDANNAVTKKAAKSTELYIPYGLAAGDHVYTINITDAADATRTTTATVTIKVVENFNVSGTIKDKADNPLSGNEAIYFYPADAENVADYVKGNTFLKYARQPISTDSPLTTLVPVAGNQPDGYDTGDDFYVSCANGDEYRGYVHDETTKTGPFPMPTILTEAPTASPAASAAASASTSAAPQFVAPVIEAGNYAAEVPAGTYTVKVRGKNGVRYQLDGKVTVAADAVAALNLTMPVRFANIKATAKFASDKAVANDNIYFESENNQYENMTFYARTDYQGVFNVSLPAGTYQAYWKDENGMRQYFQTPIKVEDATNADLGELKLAVSRYEISGAFKIHQKGILSDKEEDVLTGGYNLRFYDAKGNVKYSSYTKYKASENGTNFDKVMLDNGTYTVRVRYRMPGSTYDDDDGPYQVSYDDYQLFTVGTVTVNGGDVKQDFVLNPTTAGVTAEFANANVLALEQETVYTSTGNNDILVKFAIPKTEGQSNVRYDFSAVFNDDQKMPNNIVIYKEPANGETSYKKVATIGKNNEDYDNYAYLAEGTYIMRATPIDSKNNTQKIGNVKVKVSKHLAAYEKSSTALVPNGAPVSVVCAKNVQDKDFQYTAYVKVSVTEGKTYEVSYSSKTIGVDSVSVDAYDPQYVLSGDLSKVSGDYANGSGKVSFTARKSGDVYLEFTTTDTLYTTIDVSAVEK